MSNDMMTYLASLVLHFRYALARYGASDAEKDFAERASLAFSDRLIAAALEDTATREALIGTETFRAWVAERTATEERKAREEEERKAKARTYVQKYRQKKATNIC